MSKVFDIVTGMIMERLERGEIPWQKGWHKIGIPKNVVSRKAYRGANVLLLGMAGFGSPWFITAKQCHNLGGRIKSGSRYSPVIYWSIFEVEEDNEKKEKKQRTVLRYYQVYNLEQTEGLKVPEPEKKLDFKPIEACRKIFEGYKDRPKLTHSGDIAYYSPPEDKINMPKKELFKGAEEYYSTLFHEATHSTGHQSRLDRKSITDIQPFGSTNYSQEELTAEVGASFLCARAGIANTTIDNSAAYIQSWLKKLENDKRLVIYAAAAAQKAVDWIMENGANHEAKTDKVHEGSAKS